MRRFDVRNQIWLIIAIGFGEMEFVANLIRIALRRVPCIAIIGRPNVGPWMRSLRGH